MVGETVIEWSTPIFWVLFALGFTALVLVIIAAGRSNDKARLRYHDRTGKWPRR
jgi:hypothetical protein